MANTDDTPGSLVPKDGELWFSDKFKVDPVVLEDYGADVSVVIDTPIPLGGPVLPDHPPGEPLGDAHGLHQMVRGSPASLRAQKFTRAISFDAAFYNSALPAAPSTWRSPAEGP